MKSGTPQGRSLVKSAETCNEVLSSSKNFYVPPTQRSHAHSNTHVGHSSGWTCHPLSQGTIRKSISTRVSIQSETNIQHVLLFLSTHHTRAFRGKHTPLYNTHTVCAPIKRATHSNNSTPLFNASGNLWASLFSHQKGGRVGWRRHGSARCHRLRQARSAIAKISVKSFAFLEVARIQIWGWARSCYSVCRTKNGILIRKPILLYIRI